MSDTATTHAYVTENELGDYMNGFTATTARAVDLVNACNVGAREIDAHCGRSFWADPHGDDDEPTTRRFEAHIEERQGRRLTVVEMDDAYEIVSVATDGDDDGTAEDEWDLDDLQLEPIDGRVAGLTGFPTSRLVAIGGAFPTCTLRPSVHVTAYWGWSEIPEPVRQANLRVGHFVFFAPNAPMGVQGFNEFGAVRMPADELRFVTGALGAYCKQGGRGLPAIA